MGKKRIRVPGEPRPSKTFGSDGGLVQHLQTLEEDVRESRDVEFASKKKEAERTKRRRMAEMNSENGDSSSIPRTGNRRVDARTAGLEMWKRAAMSRKARKHLTNSNTEETDVNDLAVDGKTEAKIVQQARQQRAEVRAEVEDPGYEDDKETTQKDADAALRSLAADDSDVDEGGDDDRSFADSAVDWHSTIEDEERELEFLDGSKVTEADELALSLFNTAGGDQSAVDGVAAGKKDDGGGKLMLADIILQKIQEKEEAAATAAAIAADPAKAERDKKIAEVYGLVGNIMAKYRSGKVPKPFKVIPKLRNWEELLYLTRPDEWSPPAVYVATRLLSSNLSGKDVASFYSDILLPRCLQDIAENKKLNYHLYQALMKAVYKPDAFCKGILFPLCKDEMCTLRQAIVISSVVSKVSIPMLHSAASMVYMSQVPFNPATCLLITALIEKKYGLPYRAIDSTVDWFFRMMEDNRPLPLMWHKCLLSFAQHYKTELTREQKDKLKVLMRKHTHRLITPEIRRELFSSRNRGELLDPDANTIATNIADASMID